MPHCAFEETHDSSRSVDEKQSKNSILTEWIGMGRSGPQITAKRQLWDCLSFTMVLLALLFRSAHCQQCRIQRCNAEYVGSTSPANGLQEEVALDVDYCIALRAYAQCTRRQARSCRGDLVYHSAVFRIKELFAQHNCSSDGPTSSAKVPSTSRPGVSELCDYENRSLLSASSGQQKKYAHCGLFGDPHLRTFRNEFQTCKVEGAWPLIDNRFLSVQVTNVPVVLGSSATATSKITVIFKTYQGCTEQKVYQATTEDLPLAFQDGTRSGGESGSLTIMERGGGGGVGSGVVRQVKIQARYIGTSIIIRRVGIYLTFAIRMPEDTLDFSEDSGGLQLCLHGCPRNELIKEHTLGRQQPRLQATNTELGPLRPPHQIYTVERATAKCRETLQVEDLYFQSCVFDLLTTGDPEFSMAAYGALEDLKALPPSKLKQNSPRTPPVFNNGATQTLSAPAFNSSLLPLLFLILLLL
ncbi:RGM domain family, member D [Cyprinodon tularosa]|uniref:RGM domain family, member D n=1 Tax=Cyprinodon variegatus TaxID=28743 RepID=A0A3Q2D7S0_CYPVA|nr:PREDICTED: repulsive guidance molecule A-like [Cyprinodon variegatus]XP_038155179.1 RGM domain family, member D [Cyprinodon tularosa]